MVRFQTNRSVVARWSTGKGGEEMRYTERSSVGGRSLEDGMSLVEFLAWLDEWMPQAFGAPAHRDGALVVLRDIVVPRLIRELRERDAKGFAFYMSGNVGVMK